VGPDRFREIAADAEMAQFSNLAKINKRIEKSPSSINSYLLLPFS
jgi:hypothetical protein